MVTRRLVSRIASALAVVPLASLGLVAAAATGAPPAGAAVHAIVPERVQGHLIELTRLDNVDHWTGLDLTTTFAPGVSLDSDPAPTVDPITGYQNAFAVDSHGHLIEYTRFPAGNWAAADLTALWSGPTLGGGDAEPFVDVGTSNQSVLVTGAGGDVLDYQRAANGGWTGYDVSALSAGPPIIGTAVPFVDPVTGFQNAYGTSFNGDLFEYTRLASGTWVSLDLTAAAISVPIVGAPQPFVDPLTGFQNVYASTADGNLIEYTRLATGQWTSLDLSFRTGANSPSIIGDTAPFVDPLTGYQNVYAETLSGQLVEFTRFPNGIWQSLQIAPSGVTPGISGDPVPYVDGSAQAVFAPWGTDLVEYLRQPDGSWIKSDITAGTATPQIDGTPELIVDPVTHLLNAYFLDEVRIP